MTSRTKALWVTGLMTAAVWAQSGEKPAAKLTPRELFYLPVSGAAKPAIKPPAAVKPPARTKPVAKAETPKPPSRPAQPERPSQPAALPEGAYVMTAANQDLRPLGLRYSLLKVNGSTADEVSVDSVFHSGDKIRVSLEANEAGYLYIVMRGTSGSWRLLFPAKEINNGDNRVQPMQMYTIPPAPSRFTFDEQPGEEKLFIVLTRQPEPDLEKLIYSLHKGGGTVTPTSQPDQPKQLLYAMNNPINDDLVGRVRNKVYARDLVFEKVDESTPGEKKEKAVYVVNTTGKPDARLVVDLKLQHK